MLRFGLSFVLGSAASLAMSCGGTPAPAPAPTATPAVTEPGSSATVAAPPGPTAAAADVCRSDGSHEASFAGSGLSSLEGRTVWALLLERRGSVVGGGGTTDTSEREPPMQQVIWVRLSGTVTSGSLQLACPKGLPAQGFEGYPHVLVVADVDGTTGCSAGDAVLESSTLYGIKGAFRHELTLRPDARGTVGDVKQFDVCAHITP